MAQSIVNELIATTTAQSAGAIVFWTLAGPVDFSRLAETWEAAGLPADECPKPQTLSAIVSRIMRDMREAGVLVRRVEGSWVLATEQVVGTDAHGGPLVEYDQTASLTVVRDETVVVSPPDSPLAQSLGERIALERRTLDSVGCSMWITDLIASVDGIALRDRGGLYFVPPHGRAKWEKVSAAIQAASGHRFFLIDAMRTDQAMEALAAAVEGEASAILQGIEDEIAGRTASGEAIKARAARNRLSRTAELSARVRRYEELLGSALPAIHERVDLAERKLTLLSLGG